MVAISNAPPFISNEDLAKGLSLYGQLVSPIKMLLLGCKAPRLERVVCLKTVDRTNEPKEPILQF